MTGKRRQWAPPIAKRRAKSAQTRKSDGHNRSRRLSEPVFAGPQLGAAWQKVSNEGRDYLSVKLDDPSFPAPIYATLIEVEGEEGLQLIWSRPNRD